MKYAIWITIFLVGVSSWASQIVETPDSNSPMYSEERYDIKGLNYVDFIYHNHEIWAVSTHGHLVRWDVATNLPIADLYDLDGLTFIKKTHTGDIYVGNTDGNILKLNERTHQWDVMYSIHTPVYGVCIMDKDTQYAVTNNGVMNLLSKSLYRPVYSMNSQFDYYTETTIGSPSAILCDSKSNIWLGYNKGEWGGDIHLFSTQHEEYLPLKIAIKDIILSEDNHAPIINVLPITSIVEGPNHVIYITSGAHHLTEMHGAILQFRESHQIMGKIRRVPKFPTPAYTGTPIFLFFPPRKAFPFTAKNEHGNFISPGYIDHEEYIGSGSMNPYSGKFSYYSNRGFYMIEHSSKSQEVYRKQLFPPILLWEYEREKTVGQRYSLIVTKFEFINELTIAFLAESDGIGIFDGRKLKFYK